MHVDSDCIHCTCTDHFFIHVKHTCIPFREFYCNNLKNAKHDNYTNSSKQ